MSARRVVLLAGNPNAGKTTLFNALTGARARTGNYPGVTVDRRVGRVQLDGGVGVDLIDIPGTYSLTARSPEEQIAIDTILPWTGRGPAAIVVVCDAGALERHLYLAHQMLETGIPAVVALNMMDEARAAGIEIDVPALETALGVPVIPIVARRGEGLDALRRALASVLEGRAAMRSELELPEGVARDIEEVETALPGGTARDADPARRARAAWAVLSVGDDELAQVPSALRVAVARVRARAESEGRSLDREIIAARYRRIDEIARTCLRVPDERARRRLTDRIDSVLTHPVLGSIVFVLAMGVLFQALFTWSEPMIAAIEDAVAASQGWVRGILPEGALRDLITVGVIGGAGNVVVFVPQIAILSFLIALLEDCGYLARVAFVIDRVMRGVGLHGRAFVPLLSGFACAIPAVLATRTIENRRDRLVTMLALPLMSCSARLPVYTLMIAVAFPAHRRLAFGLSIGAVALLAMYLLSVAATLTAAAVLRRTVLRGPQPALVLELPPYRAPVARNLALAVWDRTRAFLIDAGTIILAISIVLWALLSYPRDEAAEAGFERARVAIESGAGGGREEALEEIAAEQARVRMENSVGGRFGRWIEPAIAPLGFDWRIGVGLLGSFAAREVLVSTLGIVYGAGEGDEESDSLRERLRDARRPDGSRLFTPLVGLSLMVFFVLAAQCMSTLAIVRRESGSWKWPLLMLAYMNALAYVAALAVYQIGRGLGLS